MLPQIHTARKGFSFSVRFLFLTVFFAAAFYNGRAR